ncbi:MAG TPA: zf-HC2 domain-containing protein [Pseudonocardiaceae bacterium]|nr:zf-HC2 domain-containing protein [Pseudonocardiaceae bacterium]
MSSRDDDHLSNALGAYVLGALDPRETREVTAHLADCAECRALAVEFTGLKDKLGAVPREIFLDGLPDGGDLVLRRTLRQVRTEHHAGLRTRTILMSAGAVIAVAAVLGGGILLGRNSAPGDSVALPAPSMASGRTPSIRAAVHMHGAQHGAELSVTVMPAGGWVRVSAWVAGVPTGQKCQLVVVSRSGRTEVAGSWLVSHHGTAIGTNLEGAALIPADDVVSVQVRNFDGYTFVSAST